MMTRFAPFGSRWRSGSRWLFPVLLLWRVLLWLMLGLVAAAVVVALVFQFWFLPRANDYRDDIAAAVRKATGVQIQIGSLEGEWRDWRPHVTLGRVLVRDARGHDALFIDSIRSEIAWKSIALLEVRLHRLDVSQLTLEIRRDAAGQLFVAGLPLQLDGASNSGLGDWLLRQDAVRLQDSRIRWVDEKHAAPPLELGGVLLELTNRFGLHRVRLQATPPSTLGSPFRLEAELRGRGISDSTSWHGTVDVAMPYVNLGEAQRHWHRMGRIEQGAGSLEARFEFDHGAVRHARAKVALAQLRARLGADLDLLELTRLTGAIEVERATGSLKATLRDVGFTTPDGLSQLGVTGSFERTVTETGVLETQLDFNAIDLGPVSALASRLPLSQPLRVRLMAMQPQGRLTKLRLGTREQAGRLVKYSLSADFANLGMRATDRFPGFSGMSGTVKASERSGELTLAGRKAQLDLPRIFTAALPIDQLGARMTWQVLGDAIDVKVQQFDVANRDFAGKVSGSYRHVRGNAGQADLVASLSRADATAVWRYVPLLVPETVRTWLRQALLAGGARQADLVLRGNLADFPFSHGRPGKFEVNVKADGGIVDYVPGWPRLEAVSCQLVIRANQLEITQGNGRIFGTTLRNASVKVADLGAAEPAVSIRGEAQGRSADFLRYLKESPLSKAVGSAALGLQVQGEGRLDLTLEIPLKHPESTKADGTFTPVANRLTLPSDLGVVEQLSGVLRISEHGLSARGLSATYLGGPVRFDLVPPSTGGMEVIASGRASSAGIARFLRMGLEPHLSGATDWRGRFGLHTDRIDALVESDLAGLASQLPAPLGKASADKVALRVERSKHPSGMGLLRAQWGDRVLVRYLSPLDHWFDIRTGEIVFNGRSGDSERDGLRVSGRLAELDMDAWGALLRERPGVPESGGAVQGWALPELALRGLQVERLRWFGREFNGITITGRHTQAATQVNLEGRSVQGELTWRDQGSGQLTARMARLYLPAVPGNGAHLGQQLSAQTLPGIEAEVQDFRLGEREFGKLVLSAVPQGRVWNLRQLNLTSPDGGAQLRGLYDLRGRVPRTNVEVRVDVSDIGSYLTRLRLPQGIKRGKARLEGNLEWSGAPYSLDLASLTGRLVLEAKQGQFTKIDPGMGKLLGVLSLQSLPRRLTLDFRDVFSQGFGFTQINATSAISGGVATTQDFKMVGPAAAVEIKGGADLLRETQNLRVRVIPGVGDNLTVAGAIVNPAIGLAAYLAQKVFNDPVNKLFATEYNITGSWADPQVSKHVPDPPVSRSRR